MPQIRRRKADDNEKVEIDKPIQNEDFMEDESEPQLLLSDEDLTSLEVVQIGTRATKICGKYTKKLQKKVSGLETDSEDSTALVHDLLEACEKIFDSLSWTHDYFLRAVDTLSKRETVELVDRNEKKREEEEGVEKKISQLYEIMATVLSCQERSRELFPRNKADVEKAQKAAAQERKRLDTKKTKEQKRVRGEAEAVAAKYNMPPRIDLDSIPTMSSTQRSMLDSDYLADNVEAVVSKLNIMRSFLERAYYIVDRPNMLGKPRPWYKTVDPSLMILVAFIIIFIFVTKMNRKMVNIEAYNDGV